MKIFTIKLENVFDNMKIKKNIFNSQKRTFSKKSNIPIGDEQIGLRSEKNKKKSKVDFEQFAA